MDISFVSMVNVVVFNGENWDLLLNEFYGMLVVSVHFGPYIINGWLKPYKTNETPSHILCACPQSRDVGH